MMRNAAKSHSRLDVRIADRPSPIALRLALLPVLSSFFFLPACGGRDLEQVPVSGTVTLDGGPMPGSGTIFFTPVQSAGDTKRPGTAEFNADGKYTAGSFEPGDGLVPGSYTVKIHCWEVSPNSEEAVPVSYIPEHYTNAATSGLTLEVPAGSSAITKNFDLVSDSP